MPETDTGQAGKEYRYKLALERLEVILNRIKNDCGVNLDTRIEKLERLSRSFLAQNQNQTETIRQLQADLNAARGLITVSEKGNDQTVIASTEWMERAGKAEAALRIVDEAVEAVAKALLTLRSHKNNITIRNAVSVDNKEAEDEEAGRQEDDKPAMTHEEAESLYDAGY